jgi:hypothetical protein
MGLDIMFNKEKALLAGLQLTTTTNGMPEDIAQARAEGDNNHAEWLAEEIQLTQLPGTDLNVIVNEFDHDYSIRANPWGRVYAPLTDWLRSHDIPWIEC